MKNQKINKYKNMNIEKGEPTLKGEKNESLSKPGGEKHAKPEFKPSNFPGINKGKEDPLYAAKKKVTLRDGILTLIGNQLNSIGFGCLMVIFNLTTYLMSYLRHYQEKKNNNYAIYIFYRTSNVNYNGSFYSNSWISGA